jgi:hypothetical protein
VGASQVIDIYLQLRIYNNKNEEVDRYNLELNETINDILYPSSGYAKVELYNIVASHLANTKSSYSEYKISEFKYNTRAKKWELI